MANSCACNRVDRLLNCQNINNEKVSIIMIHFVEESARSSMAVIDENKKAMAFSIFDNIIIFIIGRCQEEQNNNSNIRHLNQRTNKQAHLYLSLAIKVIHVHHARQTRNKRQQTLLFLVLSRAAKETK
jgi:hypothetical protein